MSFKRLFSDDYTTKTTLNTTDLFVIGDATNGFQPTNINTSDVVSEITNSLPSATFSSKGIIQLADTNDIFYQNNNKAVTAGGLYEDVRLAKFSAGNSITGLTQSVAPNNTYNLLTSLISTSESQNGNQVIQYKDINNNVQNYILDDVNDRFLFPSNLYTYNNIYTRYTIRIELTYNITSTTNQTTICYIRLRRVINNTVVPAGTLRFSLHNTQARTGETFNGIFETFVNSETDPFALDGCYLSVENDSTSSDTIVVTGVNIRIFKD